MLKNYKREIDFKSKEGKKMAEEVVCALAKELFESLDDDGSDSLDWTEFKKLNAMSKQKTDDCMNFISDHI